MFKRFSLHQVLLACFAMVALIPVSAMFVWDEWIAIEDADQAYEWLGHLVILAVGLAAALGMGSLLARRVAREEDKLRRQNQQLAHAMRLAAMAEMASGIAHEINQPLAAVAAYIDGSIIRLRAGEPAGVDILDALDKAAEQARRAAAVLRRVRAFVSDSTSGPVPIDLARPIRDGLDVVKNEAHLMGVTLDITFSDSPLPVNVDAIQIQQIVVHLVRTILDVLRDAAGEHRRIRIATMCKSDGTARLVIGNGAVKVGRVAEIRMQDPFFATEAGRQAMRLRICRTIAEAHEGKLVVERPADGGAFFELILPLGKPPHE